MKKILLLFILILFSCNPTNPTRICCGSPPPDLMILISDINESDITASNVASKTSLYYFSENGTQNQVSLRSSDGSSYITFDKELEQNISGQEYIPCNIILEKTISLNVDKLLELSGKQDIKRFYLKLGQQIDTIDLNANYDEKGSLKYNDINLKINNNKALDQFESQNIYYYSKKWNNGDAQPKISCLPNNTPLNIVISDANLVSGLVDNITRAVDNISKNKVKISYKNNGIEKTLSLGNYAVYFRADDDQQLEDYDTCISCRSILKDNVTIVLPMELLNLATSENQKIKEFFITLNDTKVHRLTIDDVNRISINESKLKNLSYDEFIVKRVSLDGISLDKGNDNTFHFSETWKDGVKKPWEKWNNGNGGTQCSQIKNCEIK